MRKQIFTAIVLALFVIISGRTAAQQAKPFTLKLGAVRGSIQWEQSFDRNTWTNIGGGITDSLQVQATKTTYYRAKITEAGCAPVYSDVKAAFINGGIVVGAKLVRGKISLPNASVLKPAELSVLSLLDSTKIKPDGSFQLLVADSTEEEMLFVINEKGEPMMLGFYAGAKDEYLLSAESTGLCLLTMYPYFKPISTAQKVALLQQYKNQPEFQDLLNFFDTALQAGNSPFAVLNNSVKEILFKLISKDYNKDRLRTSRSSKTLEYEEIGIERSGSSFTLDNTMAFSYVGGIYNKQNKKLNSFVLPGKLMADSRVVQLLIARTNPTGIAINSYSQPQAFDLKTIANSIQGEYEVRLRSGAYDDGSPESSIARKENLHEGITAVLINIVPSILGLRDWSCFGEIVLTATENIITTADFLPQKNWVHEYVIPNIFNAIDIADCRAGYLPSIMKITLKVASIAYDAWKEWPSFSFFPTWLTYGSVIQTCHFLSGPSNSSKIYPCSVMKPIDPIGNNIKRYTGDSVEIKVKSIENKFYYPHTEDVVSKFPFIWFISLGNGHFGNRGSASVPDNTDDKGFSSIQWYMSCLEENNSVKAIATLDDLTYKDDILQIESYNPKPSIKHKGNDQRGEPGHKLPANLQIWLTDLLDQSQFPMLIGHFRIKWQYVKGTGKVEAVTSALDKRDSSFSWTLGPEAGEQEVQATIEVKNPCLQWQLIGNPIVFKANKPVQKSVSIFSGNNQEGAQNIYLSDFLVVKVLDESGNPISGVTVEWSITSGGGSLETLTDVTDNDGLAKTKWKLGSTGIQQAIAIVKKPDGTNVDGSPAIFNANLLLPKTVSLVSGDNQGSGPDSYLADFLIVKVLDENNNPVIGTSVQWTVVSGGGSVENASTVTDNNGLAKTKWKLGLSGDQQVKATVKKPDGSDITGSPVVFNAGFAIITTIAGNGIIGYSGDGGDALNASINPSNICVDKNGNVYFAENTRIRKVNMQTGIITTVAGNGRMPAGNNGAPNHIFVVSDGAPATADSISTTELCVDNSGNLYFGSSRRIRKVNAATGIISTILGPGIADSLGNYPLVGRADSVYVGQVRSLVFDEQGNLFYVAHDRVFKLSAATNRVSIYAGNGSQGNMGDGGPATAASFYNYGILSTDKPGNLYIVDGFYSVVRKVTASTGIVSKVAGIGIGNYSGDGGPAVNAALATPTSVAIDSDGNVLISDYGNYRIRRVNATTGIITTVIGTGQNSFSGDGGNPAQATLAGPRGVYIDKDGYIYINDWSNGRIRRAKLFK